MVRVAIVLLLFLLPSGAWAQGRLALLIGNQAYNAKVGPLKNSHGDVDVVGRALEAIGFRITVVKDATRRDVLSEVRAFVERLAQEGPEAIGFFYYSGHGISRPEDRANYLIPVDLRDTESADFWFDAVKLDDILAELERVAPAAAHFVVFDTCRNELKLPAKSVGKLGFSPVTERTGMYIAFATAPGAVASDQGVTSGPYAGALAAELTRPGQDHLQLFQNVKEGVYSTTGNRQLPWASDGMLKRVYLGGMSTASSPVPVAPRPPPPLPIPPKVSEAPRATAERRLALVIANQAYTQAGARLTNTHRDGDLVKSALEKVGFKVWVVRDTANEGAMRKAIGDHVERLARAGPEAVGFLYYSGHGAADRPDGANYLIPTEAPLTHASQLPLMGVRLDSITTTLANAGKINFVVFDACRNVPLQRADKDLTFKGFAPVREQRGLLVAYATEPGSVAVDQSIYATALAEEIAKPGLEASQAFRAVTRRVLKDTGDKQSPEYLDKRLFDFHFAAATAPPGSAAPSDRNEMERAWAFIKKTDDQSQLEAFVMQFGDSPYAPMARARLEELKRKQTSTPSKAPGPAPAASGPFPTGPELEKLLRRK